MSASFQDVSQTPIKGALGAQRDICPRCTRLAAPLIVIIHRPSSPKNSARTRNHDSTSTGVSITDISFCRICRAMNPNTACKEFF